MAGKLALLFLLLIQITLTNRTLTAQDAKALLQAVARNIGADSLQCVTYSGTGYVGIVGQNYTPRDDWPRVELASYTKTVNFDAKTGREEQVTRQGTHPARGGGVPLDGEARQVSMVSGNHAWVQQGANASPVAAARRQLDLWLTPHGFVKAALAAAKPVMLTRYEGGEAAASNA
jgi:hypothetical protein